MKYNGAILEVAGQHKGLKEWAGAKHNPQIVAFFNAVGQGWVKDDETPWCAAFVGAVLAEIGLQGTGKLNARSYKGWGQHVSMQDAQAGDIVVLWRGTRNGWQGHVAFLVRFDGDKVILRGGNQGNQVSDAGYSVGRILAIRRADGSRAEGNRATLRQGDSGAFVLDLQDQLKKLRYFSGKTDGEFGPLTAGSVITFQGENGLVADAIVGPATWKALATASARPERDIDLAEMRVRGSTTIANADKIDVIAAGTGMLAVGREISSAAQEATGLLDTVTAMVVNQWPALLVIGCAVVAALWFSGKMKSERVRKARQGGDVTR